MPNSHSPERDPWSDLPITRAMVPILMAVGAVTLAIVLTQGNLSAQAPVANAAAQAASDAATPYSEDHRRVEEAPGDPEPLPPLF